MRRPELDEADLTVESVEVELKEIEKVERIERRRPFILLEGRKFPNTDSVQTRRFGRG